MLVGRGVGRSVSLLCRGQLAWFGCRVVDPVQFDVLGVLVLLGTARRGLLRRRSGRSFLLGVLLVLEEQVLCVLVGGMGIWIRRDQWALVLEEIHYSFVIATDHQRVGLGRAS